MYKLNRRRISTDNRLLHDQYNRINKFINVENEFHNRHN